MLDLTGAALEARLGVACAKTQSPGHEDVAEAEQEVVGETAVAPVNKAVVGILDTTAARSVVQVAGESVVEEGTPHRGAPEEGTDRRIHAVSCHSDKWALPAGYCAVRAS